MHPLKPPAGLLSALRPADRGTQLAVDEESQQVGAHSRPPSWAASRWQRPAQLPWCEFSRQSRKLRRSLASLEQGQSARRPWPGRGPRPPCSPARWECVFPFISRGPACLGGFKGSADGIPPSSVRNPGEGIGGGVADGTVPLAGAPGGEEAGRGGEGEGGPALGGPPAPLSAQTPPPWRRPPPGPAPGAPRAGGSQLSAGR